MLKILFSIDSMKKGGKERQLLELVKGLSIYNNIIIEIIIMNEDIEYNEIKETGFKTHIIVRQKRFDFSVFKKFLLIYKNFKPDIIHTWDSMTTFYFLPIKIFKKTKLINGSIRFAASNIKSNIKLYYFNKFLYLFSDFIVANSLGGLTTFSLNLSYKNRCIYNGFDLARIEKMENAVAIKKKLNIESKKIICMVSSFEDHKDNQTYIKAALMILKNRNDVVFLAVGKGKKLNFCKHPI